MPQDCCSKCAGYSKPYPVCYDVKCACHEKPTDNPSSSVPVSKGEEILSMFEALVYGTIRPRDSRIKLVSLIDSALASQEARHRQEMEEAEDRLDEEMAAHETTRLLCSEEQRRAEAAEQREREAGEREKASAATHAMLYDFVEMLGKWPVRTGLPIRDMFDTAPLARKLIERIDDPAALAALRPAPSPVSAPPTHKPQINFEDRCIVPGCEGHPASPVEPGSDPQEPETR